MYTDNSKPVENFQENYERYIETLLDKQSVKSTKNLIHDKKHEKSLNSLEKTKIERPKSKINFRKLNQVILNKKDKRKLSKSKKNLIKAK